MEDTKTGLKKCSVLCIIKNRTNFLLLKRNKEPHQNKYIPVGGKIEPFESPREAAFREINEETGRLLNKLKFCGVLVETSPVKFNWVNFVFLAESEYFLPPDCNEGSLEWIKFENMLNIPTPKTDWYIYDYVLKSKNFMFNAVYNEKIELIKLTDEIEEDIIFS